MGAVLPAEPVGGDTVLAAEGSGEIGGAFIACLAGDLGNRPGGLFEVDAGNVEALLQEVAIQAGAVHLFKSFLEFEFVDAGFPGELTDGEMGIEMGIYPAFDGGYAIYICKGKRSLPETAGLHVGKDFGQDRDQEAVIKLL